MRKNLLLLLILTLIGYQIVFAQINYYTAAGKDSITYAATNQGLLILKRDSTQTLQYHSLINDSGKVYNKALDNNKYLILGTNNSVDLFSLSNKYQPSHIGSLFVTNIIAIRPFGDNFAILRVDRFSVDSCEQYIIGIENDSITILDSINSVSASYTGRTAFYPQVVYPYFFNVGKNSSIVMYKFNEGEKILELIDTINVVTPGDDLVEIFGAKERLFILERSTYYDHNRPQYYISVNKYSTHNDTLTFLSKVFSYSSGVGLIDEIECSDSLIRYNGSYTYLNSSAYLTEPNGYFSSSATAGLSGNRIYCISRDALHLYYSTKISENTIYSDEYIYKPTSVNDISNVKNFILFQNYPNPFNPTTSIQYSVAKTGLVIIKVYDIMGREVTQLVNDIKRPGNYDVSFNASTLASGVYFYRMQAGSFIGTKKMILLK